MTFHHFHHSKNIVPRVAFWAPMKATWPWPWSHSLRFVHCCCYMSSLQIASAYQITSYLALFCLHSSWCCPSDLLFMPCYTQCLLILKSLCTSRVVWHSINFRRWSVLVFVGSWSIPFYHFRIPSGYFPWHSCGNSPFLKGKSHHKSSIELYTRAIFNIGMYN